MSFLQKRNVYLLVLLFMLTNVLTFFGTTLYYKQQQVAVPPVDPTVESTEIEEELKPLVEALDILSKRYLEDVSREELINAAISGMVESLGDPQTNFFTTSDYNEMMIKIDGSFSGIGVEISAVDDYITVVETIKNTPGEKAGLLAGDRIVAVDGQSIVGVTPVEAAQMMRGPEGTKVTLTVERENIEKPLTFTIMRANIVVPSVFAEMLEGKIAYIQITTFDEHTGSDFQKALLELEAQGMRGLILDLRDNPGGLLDQAVKIGQEILPAGPITHMVDREGNLLQTYQSYGTEKNYPIVVLINGNSASASEIIAGALQDTGTAILVGTKTYGKATVQHLEALSNQSGIRYTVAKYQTPKGRDIHGQGLEPDVQVELTEDYFVLRHGIITELKPGDEGANVLILQKILRVLGYSVDATGKFDEVTVQAVRSFQEQHNLSVSGQVDLATRKEINKQIESILPAKDLQLQKALEIIDSKIK